MTNIINLIDSNVYNFIMNFQCDFMDYFMIFITNFASAPVLIVATIVAFIIFKEKLPTVNLFAVFIVNRILKLIFMRERPQEVIHFVHETG